MVKARGYKLVENETKAKTNGRSLADSEKGKGLNSKLAKNAGK